MEQLQPIQSKIYEIRGQRVMLDFDLAELYQVETKALNRAVKRNIERFPERYMFQLNKTEFENLRFQIGTSRAHGGTRYLPYAFTEQGVSMLSAVLRSPTAIQVSILIIDAFVAITSPQQPKSQQNWPKCGRNLHCWSRRARTMPKRSATCRKICAKNSTIFTKLSRPSRLKFRRTANRPDQ